MDAKLAVLEQYSQDTKLQVEGSKKLTSTHKDTNDIIGGNATKYKGIASHVSINTKRTIPKYLLVTLAYNILNVEGCLEWFSNKLECLQEYGRTMFQHNINSMDAV